ncbi:hypothetical protein GJ744_007270 [Endocarpon pusillum]|uniref:Uncharacterized protein n=1 Tax=Endocarpon pusillum TaxID=364733 RepID=A0A8H7AMU0_9EURO|nr:hypothetical protein GJ744_007270 [Endocarpon pusillum]
MPAGLNSHEANPEKHPQLNAQVLASTGSYTMLAHPSKMEPQAHLDARHTCQQPTGGLHLRIGSASGARHNCADRRKALPRLHALMGNHSRDAIPVRVNGNKELAVIE